jgi:GMP reductase
MKIEEDTKLDFNNVLIKPKYSTLKSRKDVNLNVTYTFKHSGHTWTGIPIIASNMDGVGTIQMVEALAKYNMLTCIVKTEDKLPNPSLNNNYIISTGTNKEDYERLKKILDFSEEVKFVCIDVANGYSQHFLNYISKVREKYKTRITIMAGNVVTPEMAQMVINAGADIVKIGIGSGAVCTTRIQTGIGYPQLSAVMECREVVHQLGAHLVSDGGCTCPGDVSKAFGAGADFVMLGSMFAGHDEGGGEIITRTTSSGYYSENNDVILNTVKRVQFYGMSSDTAMKKHHGGVADYRSSEGRTVEVEYKGPVENTIKNLLGGIRSTCTYVGAKNLSELYDKTTFIKVNKQFNDVFVK